jgi:hypothetical protein
MGSWIQDRVAAGAPGSRDAHEQVTPAVERHFPREKARDVRRPPCRSGCKRVLVPVLIRATGEDRAGGGDVPPATTSTTQTSTSGLSQHFAPATRPGGRNYFEGETMFVKASGTGPVLVPAESDDLLQDVRMSVHAKWVSGAQSYGIGLICRYASPHDYYLLGVLNGSQYNIVRYRKGRPGVSLTGGVQTSEAIHGDDYDIDVRCVGSEPVTLTLSVDGQEVDTVRDPAGIEEGNVGIRVGTSESIVTCSFRDFALHSL